MRRILLFILPVLIIIAIALAIFGIAQVSYEREKLVDEMTRKANAICESMEFTVKNILENNDFNYAERLVAKFQKRQRIQGCAIYGKTGNILAITERFRGWNNPDAVKSIFENKSAQGKLTVFNGMEIYYYDYPIYSDDNGLLGAIEIMYDTSYVFKMIAELWKRLIWVLVGLIISIVVIAFFVQRSVFVAPVEKLTEWFKEFQKGDIDKIHPIKDKDVLGKLANEVEQVALSLRVARKTVQEESSQRIQNDQLWNEAKLRDLVLAKLGENALYVVSNREPYIHMVDDMDNTKCVRPASGVVTAIDPILRACGGTWVGHGSGNNDKAFVNSKNKLGVPPDDIRYILKRVWLTKEEEEGYYYGFSNEGLWPLCHNTYTRPIFREKDWELYKKVNQKFADSLIEELPAKSPFIFIQDYHFAVLPRMIKEKRPDAIIALFWHIPWPNPEIFAICPYQNEILDGMLGSDLIGFHVQNHCNNFMDTANRLLESRVDAEKFSVTREGKETYIKSFPISIDFKFEESADINTQKKIERLKKEYKIQKCIVAVGVERIDYTKGIQERMLAVDRFLDKYPEFKDYFVFIQLAAPSRTHIKRYHDLMGEIDELVEKINWKHMTAGWKPIIYLKRHFSPEEIMPYYTLGDICIVSSLHDGMNLVAKEYVSAKNDLSGALILSKFTGASRELKDAFIINPYSVDDFAETIRAAIATPIEEKRKRMAAMRQIVMEGNVYKWAGDIITQLTDLRKS